MADPKAWLFLGDANMAGASPHGLLDDTDHENYALHQTIDAQSDVHIQSPWSLQLETYNAYLNAGSIGPQQVAFGPEASAARALADNASEDIYILKVAGSSSLSLVTIGVWPWIPQFIGGSVWDSMQARLSSFIRQAEAAAVGTIDWQGVFWQCGFVDSMYQAGIQQYATALPGFISMVRSTLGDPTLPFIGAKIPTTGTGGEQINEQISEMLGPDGSVTNTGRWDVAGLTHGYGILDGDGVVALGTGLATCFTSGMTETNE